MQYLTLIDFPEIKIVNISDEKILEPKTEGIVYAIEFLNNDVFKYWLLLD